MNFSINTTAEWLITSITTQAKLLENLIKNILQEFSRVP